VPCASGALMVGRNVRGALPAVSLVERLLARVIGS
jgi:hypothetical protein